LWRQLDLTCLKSFTFVLTRHRIKDGTAGRIPHHAAQ
jgi:hypothetical protein